MSNILKNLLIVCIIAVILILPIGIGALAGLSSSEGAIGDSTSIEQPNVEVTISESEYGCNIGATKTLTAEIDIESDSYIFQWDSSDKKVATVRKDSGSDNSAVVTAVGEGTSDITVSVIDKSQFKIVASATCVVTVIDRSISFSVPEVVISLDKGNTATITAKAPENGEITWSSEDESVATVVDGVITAHKAGQVYLVAKSGNIEGKILVKIYNSVFTIDEIKTVAIGESATIGVNGSIGDSAIWTSADERIATVDKDGKVTGVGIGMTTIKVTSSIDDLSATAVVIVKGTGAEVISMASGKKADAAANFGKWYYLCESNIVTVAEVPTIDNGLISVEVTGIGTSGSNFFYLRYQTDDVGDVTYKRVIYIYSFEDNANIQIDGKDFYCKAGLNRVESEYTSVTPNDKNPFQLKFRSTGKFYVITTFEEISRVEKMTLSASDCVLNLTDNTSFTLTATVPGNNNLGVEWHSSNPDVATVVDGVVTAVAPGSTIITAISGNLTASCYVTVDSGIAIDGTELKSGNKSATVKAPGSWFYFCDGGTKTLYTPVMDEDGNIHANVNKIDLNGKKYFYLRYMPEAQGTYKATVTITFSGQDGSVVDLTGGTTTSAVSQLLNNGENSFEFEFTTNSDNPFQMKFYAVGEYVVHVTFTEA